MSRSRRPARARAIGRARAVTWVMTWDRGSARNRADEDVVLTWKMIA